ncbi:hypothetical protein BDQ17DRAFT_148257 [Cyathus striatus]|nr:hypothetical protein BDQ17DRAFT_148257 [Cyathus striatus]
MFKFNFSESDSAFALPLSENVQDICDLIFKAVDASILALWDRDFNAKKNIFYLDIISSIVKARSFPHLSYDIYRCWEATLLESPTRGQGYFLSNKESQKIFRNLWTEAQVIHIESHTASLESWRVIAFGYVLKRIKPSRSFGTYIQDIFPILSDYLSNIPHFDSFENGLSQEEWEDSVKTFKQDIDEYLQECELHDLQDQVSIAESDDNSPDDTSPYEVIYALTVNKYIGDGRGNPRKKLLAVNQLNDKTTNEPSPYENLDKLYTHILNEAVSAAEEGYKYIQEIFQVLTYTAKKSILSPSELSKILGRNMEEIILSLVDLHSIIYVPDADSTGDYIRFFHISFIEYLKDSSRSHNYFVDEVAAHIALGRYCFNIIIESSSVRSYEVDSYAHTYYFSHMKKSRFNDELLNKLLQRDIQSIVRGIISKIGGELEVIQSVLIHLFIFDFYTEGRDVRQIQF